MANAEQPIQPFRTIVRVAHHAGLPVGPYTSSTRTPTPWSSIVCLPMADGLPRLPSNIDGTRIGAPITVLVYHCRRCVHSSVLALCTEIYIQPPNPYMRKSLGKLCFAGMPWCIVSRSLKTELETRRSENNLTLSFHVSADEGLKPSEKGRECYSNNNYLCEV